MFYVCDSSFLAYPLVTLEFVLGGTWQIRTAVNGFADRYLATRSRYHFLECGCKDNAIFEKYY